MQKEMTDDFIRQRVHDYYWRDELSCATLTLKILSEKMDVPLHRQVLDASMCMNGAGKYGVQCGLLEGGLMFIGILGGKYGFDRTDSEAFCREYAAVFEERFGSLSCRDLRPQGFKPENPPHLCETLTVEGVAFTLDFLSDMV